MYTVVSLTVDLAGEPDTIDFTLALFGSIFYCYGSLRADGSCHGASSHLTCAHITHFDPRWWENIWGLCALFLRCVKSRRCSFFSLSPPFLLSHRAPVRGTLPYTAPCLPRRISQTRMITALNPVRHHRHPVTLYPGTCPDMSGPRGKSTEGPCWTLRREPCSGSQVRSSLLVVGYSCRLLHPVSRKNDEL